MNTPRVKVCCIQNSVEAELAIESGAHALGLVSEMPSGFGPVGEDQIADITGQIPPFVTAVLLTAKTDPSEIIAQQKRCGVQCLQLVRQLDISDYPLLRAAMPGVPLIQVIHVTGAEAKDKAAKYHRVADAILLDTGTPDAAQPQLGGTGRTHDWNISREICDSVNIPIILAGGLRPENVRSAIEQVRPFGVDVCTGVRSDGSLDAGKLKRFMHSVQ